MDGIERIVAALDLESGSDVVLGRAVELAGVHAARLIVLHVIDHRPLQATAAEMELPETEFRSRLRQHAVETLTNKLLEHPRLRRTSIHVVFGVPADVIEETLLTGHADLAILGPGRGDTTLADRFLGSTADRVVRTSIAPVLVVRRQSSKPYRRVAVAIDYSAHSANAFFEARKLVPDARFKLVHSAGDPIIFEQAMRRAGTSQAEVEQYKAARADRARQELSEFQQDALEAGELPLHILDGEPGPALVRLSKSKRIDLLAVGSRGRGAALQALLGSVARRVLSEASCDVLVATCRPDLSVQRSRPAPAAH